MRTPNPKGWNPEIASKKPSEDLPLFTQEKTLVAIPKKDNEPHKPEEDTESSAIQKITTTIDGTRVNQEGVEVDHPLAGVFGPDKRNPS